MYSYVLVFINPVSLHCVFFQIIFKELFFCKFSQLLGVTILMLWHCDHRKIFPLLIFLSLPFSFLFLTSIFLLFEGRKIKDRKKEKREEKIREEEELFCGVSLDLDLKIFRKLLASVLKILRENWETGLARRYDVRLFLAPLPGVIEPRIEFMPFGFA